MFLFFTGVSITTFFGVLSSNKLVPKVQKVRLLKGHYHYIGAKFGILASASLRIRFVEWIKTSIHPSHVQRGVWDLARG